MSNIAATKSILTAIFITSDLEMGASLAAMLDFRGI
jgi:hypothetical protein